DLRLRFDAARHSAWSSFWRPPFTALYTSIQRLDGFNRLHVPACIAFTKFGQRAVGQGAASHVGGAPSGRCTSEPSQHIQTPAAGVGGGRTLSSPPVKESAMEAWIHWMLRPGADAPEATVWIRLMAGWVFFWEGVIKFVFVNQGVGRFTKLGMPMPEALAPAIAV